MNNPATLLWLLCGVVGVLALTLLDRFSAWLPPISAPVQLWLAAGLLILAQRLGRPPSQ